MQPKLNVETVSTADLIPYAGNAKEHPDWQVRQIVESIKRFGFNDPIGVWHDADGQPIIVEGHGRVLAAKELGIDEVPVISLDHLDDEGRRAYTLVHNQLTTNTGFNLDALDSELAALGDIEMEDFGFDDMSGMTFEDFDGPGDGGGSRMQIGDKVRVVLGPVMCDIDDPEHDIYDACRKLDPDVVADFISQSIRNGSMT